MNEKLLNSNARKQANPTLWNYINVGWLTPLIIYGAKHPLKDQDLYDLRDGDKAGNLATVLDRFWTDLRQYFNGKSNTKPNLLKVLIKKYKWTFITAVLLDAIALACSLLVIVMFQQLLLSIASKTLPSKPKFWIDNELGLAFLLFSFQMLFSVFLQTSRQILNSLQVKIKTVMIGAVYEKAMRISPKQSENFKPGMILNFVNVDIEKISMVPIHLCNLICNPLIMISQFALIGTLIGVSVFSAVGTIVLIFLLQTAIVPIITGSQKIYLDLNDKRLSSIRELLNAIRVVKFRSLENFFGSQICNTRKEQLVHLKRYFMSVGTFMCFFKLAGILMPITGFITFALLGNTFSPAAIFPAFSIFNSALENILSIPQSLTEFLVGVVSWKRVDDFINADEAEDLAINYEVGIDAIVVKNATYTWDVSLFTKDAQLDLLVDSLERIRRSSQVSELYPRRRSSVLLPEQGNVHEYQSMVRLHGLKSILTRTESEINCVFQLRDIAIQISKKAKVAVVGSVGSGKSSLLMAIIGEMIRLKGENQVFGSVAYCCQQPWILTDTIQGNILLNQPLDQSKLDKILATVGLDIDLKSLPAGQRTLIGERGVNLSGGQKARIALARAMYQSSNIYLLDDPLSALDARVGQKVFQSAIMGHLKENTVVLVTHQLHLLPNMDHIIVMDNGRIVEQGKFNDLMNIQGILAEMMNNYAIDDKQDQEVVEKTERGPLLHLDNEVGILAEEDQQHGAVDSKMYYSYISASGGWKWIVFTIATAVLTYALVILRGLWLSWWMVEQIGKVNYMLGFSVISLLEVILFFGFTGCILSGAFQAATTFHERAIDSLLLAPISFYDSQPIGRILNRMSKDIECLDQQIWLSIVWFTFSTVALLLNFSFLVYISYYMIFLILPLIFIYCVLLLFYQRSNREFKRYESTYKSPLYSHISESLSGLSTIKAFKQEKSFLARQRSLMDEANIPTFLRLSAVIWISIRMELLSALVVLFLGMLGALSVVKADVIGVALLYALELTWQMNVCLKSATQLESEFNSVERLQHYCQELPREPPKKLDTDPKPDEWPLKGEIKISNLSLAYPSRPNHNVLKGLTMHVNPGEKIGIIGRTGSGKSTLMTALLRVVDPNNGVIEIDGKNIHKLGLSTLRNGIEIIPQEPILFSGTLRKNLDIKNEYADFELWDILSNIGLLKFVSSLQGKLDFEVKENGENLSVGQRQLVCLARAVLGKPRILIMDEATASVDAEADLLIQKSIKTHFRDCTVLSIAHRLSTIADFDRILVLKDGVEMEFDEPHLLLQDPNSHFSALVDATGVSSSKVIREIAKIKFNNRIQS